MLVRLLFASALLAGLLAAPDPAAAQQTKLRVTVQQSSTDPLTGKAVGRFKEDVEKRSNGEISIEVFYASKLYIDDEVVGAVASGAIEMGIAGLNQFTQRIPAMDIMEQPFLFNFEALVKAAASPTGQIRKLIDAAILDNIGVRVLWWHSLGSQLFISKERPVLDPDDIKDRKVRVFSPTHAEFIKACGGIPVMVGANKTPDAFKSGEIDMATGASSLISNRQLWTFTDRITRTQHAPIEFSLIVNEKVWQSLPEAHKAILLEAAREEEKRSRENVTRVEAGLYEQFKAKGMTVHDLTPDAVSDWRACSASVMEGYMASSSELARQLMAAYARLRTDPCCTAGPETEASFTRR